MICKVSKNIVSFSFIDHPFKKPSFVIYFCGCNRNCKNCHNQELQNYNSPLCKEIKVENLIFILFEKMDLMNCYNLVFLGGEPLLQEKAVKYIAKKIKKTFQDNCDIVLYTGYLFDEVKDDLKKYLDFIIDGEYIEELKTNSFPASANQKVYHKINNQWKIIHQKELNLIRNK